MSESDLEPDEHPRDPFELCPVPAARLAERGDIYRSYSADLIASNGRVRSPFHHAGQIWVCISIAGNALTNSGFKELEAYRLTPSSLYVGAPTSYRERTSTSEAAEAARNDPFGFYHGMNVTLGSSLFVMTGPPIRFAPEASPSRPENDGPDPMQLSLF